MAPRAANAGAVAQEAEAPMHGESTQDDGPVVYFVQSENGGPVKIGYVNRASGLTARLAALQTGCAYPLRVVKTVPGGSQMEQLMHGRFERWRLSGEWFLPSKEIEAFCGVLSRRDDSKALQRLVDRVYQQGHDDGYGAGYEAGQRNLAERMFRVLGSPEEWTSGTHMERSVVEEAA
jgi:hypothetical protein